MTAGADMNGDRRSAWLVVRAMHAELLRQAREGSLTNASRLEDGATVFVTGTVDLARLADVTEKALRTEFHL